jgi:hypothetical protein
MASSRDTKLYTISDPWFGDTGDEFKVVFKPAFLTGLGKQADKFVSLKKHLAGGGPGNVKPTNATQLAADVDHINAMMAHA